MTRERVEDIAEYTMFGLIGVLLALCIGLFIGAAVGVVPTSEPDPCEYGGTGKTASHYHDGWITYGGRSVLCNGRRP